MTGLTEFDKTQLRSVLGAFTTGVTVITTCDADGKGHGLTANSFSSVSLDPPLVLWSQAKTSSSFHVFNASDHFAINILADDQIDVSNHFAKKGEDKLSVIPHSRGVGGVPVVDGVSAHLECEKFATYPGGDHVVYLGLVKSISSSGRRPLVFGGGRYMVSYAHDLGPVSLQLGEAPVASQEQIDRACDRISLIAEAVGDHTTCLTIWGNHGPTALKWAPSRHPVSPNLRSGLVFNVTSTAAGRAFAAFLPAKIVGPFVEEDLRLFREPGADAVAQREAFDAEMEETRQQGLSRTIDPRPARRLHEVETHAFAAPVFNGKGEMIMAISIVDRPDRLPSDFSCADAIALHREAAALSAEFGWTKDAAEAAKAHA